MKAQNAMLTPRQASEMLQVLDADNDWCRFLKRDRLRRDGHASIPFMRKRGKVLYHREYIVRYAAFALFARGLLKLDLSTFEPDDWTVEDLLAECAVRQEKIPEQHKNRAAAIVAWIKALFGFQGIQPAQAV